MVVDNHSCVCRGTRTYHIDNRKHILYYIINIGEMPAGKQSKSRRDSLLPDWGQIITIEYYRMDDTLSREGYRGACIFDTGALSAPIS